MLFLLLGSFLQTAIRHKKRNNFALFCDIHSCMSKINWKFYKNMLMFIILSIILIQVCINYRNNKIKIRYKICLVITSDIEQNADPRKSSSIIFVPSQSNT